MPRIRAVVEFSEVVEVTVRPGVNTVRFLISVTPESLSSWADRAMTEIGTSWMFSARFCAVTMTSGKLGTGASSAPQLALAATTPVDAKTKVATPRLSRIRLVIALPSVRQSFEQQCLNCCVVNVLRMRPSTSWSGGRKGSREHLASGDNPLTGASTAALEGRDTFLHESSTPRRLRAKLRRWKRYL